MSGNTSAEVADDGICVAYGFGLKIHVDRKHLIVEDGVGRQRRYRKYHRATSRLRRLVIIGHTGYITLEAIRWVNDIGAVFVHIDQDGNLLALSAPARHHESKLRRAQVLAPETAIGGRILTDLLRAKLEAQAELVEQLAHLRSELIVDHKRRVTPAQRILEYASELDAELTVGQLRRLESSAGRVYWQTWAKVPVSLTPELSRRAPEHWHIAGSRSSSFERKSRVRKAISPVHALLNYGYAMLETETTIALHTMGLDPSLGLMHTDLRYRGSLAADVMEPARPTVDRVVLELLECRPLGDDDIFETREGICRLGPGLARELAGKAPDFRRAVAPHAESVAHRLSGSTSSPMPLTRVRHNNSVGRTVNRTLTSA